MSSSTDAADAAYLDFVTGVEIEWIEVVQLRADKHGVNPSEDFQVQIGGANALGDDHFLSRFEAKASVKDSEGEDVANFEVALIIKFSSPPHPDADLVERFARSTGIMLATPYLRENLSSLAQRVNVKGVVMPLIRMQPDPAESEDGPAED